MEGYVLECLQRLHDPIPLPDNTPVTLGRSPQTQITEARCSRHQVEIQVDWKVKEIKVTQLGVNTSSIDGQDLEQGKPVCMSPDSTLFILKGMFPHKVSFRGASPPPESSMEQALNSVEPEKDMPPRKKRQAEYTEEVKGDSPPPKKHKRLKNGEDDNQRERNGEEKDHTFKGKRKVECKLQSSRPDGNIATVRPRMSEEKEEVYKKRPKEETKPERNGPKQTKKEPGSGKSVAQKVTDFFPSSKIEKREKDRDTEKQDKDPGRKERDGSSEKKGKYPESSPVRKEKRSESSSDRREKHPETRDRDSKSDYQDSKLDRKIDRKSSSEIRKENKKSLQDMSDDDDAHVQAVSEKLQQLKQKAKSEKPDSKVPPRSSKSDEKRKSSVDSSSKCKVGKPATTDSWDSLDDRLYILTCKGVCASEKIAGFDIDGTIITTQSGRVFPRDIHDWRILMPEVYGKLKYLLAANYKIVFFSNQLGVGRGAIKIEDLQDKFEKVIHKLQVPVQIFISTKGGSYRKPALGMWQILKKQKNDGIPIRMADSFYVGDAAGRQADWAPKKKKDFSCSDRLFALNAGLKFHTPEEFFLGHRVALYNLPDFDPRAVSTDTPLLQGGESLTSSSPEVVVFVGLQASGKTSFAKNHLIPKGYVHINQDVLKTWQKCVSECTKALEAGKSVVIDNTNVEPETRARYIDCARKARKPCRCFFFDFTISQCRHNERFREITNKEHKPINEQIFNSTKSKFKPPELREGFSKIVRVNFVPHFPDKLHEKVYRQFLLEK